MPKNIQYNKGFSGNSIILLHFSISIGRKENGQDHLTDIAFNRRHLLDQRSNLK